MLSVLSRRLPCTRRIFISRYSTSSNNNNSNDNSSDDSGPASSKKNPRRRALNSKKILNLEDFIFQRKVFKLYRAIVRAAHQAPDKHTANELIQYAKGEFDVCKNVSDKHQKRYLLAMGQNQFRDTCKGIGLSYPIHINFDEVKT